MDGLESQLNALAALLQKQESYRQLYQHLQQFQHHPNYCIWISTVQCMAAKNQLEISLATNRLNLGVFAT